MSFPRPLLFLLGLFLLPTAANALKPQEFASGFPLGLEGDATFYEVELPVAAYNLITRPDLGDLRIFNHSGSVVPHQLRPQPSVTIGSTTQHRAVHFFPLPATGNGQLADDLSLHIERSSNGTIIDLRTVNGSTTKTIPPAGWLIDTGASTTGQAMALNLTWEPTVNDAIGDVRIDSSNDLVNWASLTTGAIASLSFQGQHLTQNRIPLPRLPHRYLRLTWPPELVSLKLSAVDLSFETAQHIALPLQHLTVKSVQAAKADQYLFSLPGPLAVEEVRLLLADRNSLAECRLDSAEQSTGPWRSNWHGLAYRLGSGNSEINSPVIALNRNRQRYWRLDCAASEAGLQSPPSIDFSWRPDRILFLAQGEPPYLLAVGSRKIGPAQFAVDRLSQNQINPGRAFVLGQQPLGGDLNLLPSQEPLPWKKIILWVLLGGGVLLIGALAFSLQRQMRAAGNASGNRNDND